MSDLRADVLEWIDAGRLPPDAAEKALRIAGVMPSRGDWRLFFDRLCLWLGVVFLAAAVIFFFAYNWQAMGRYGKFAAAEAPILIACLAAWRFGLDGVAGKAMLLLISLLIGALLALVGQIYQTGADTFELFAAWAAAILPLVLLARFSALWLFWIALLDLALVLYCQTFGWFFRFAFDKASVWWMLFCLNTLALCVWEGFASAGIEWLRERWATRVLAVASGATITALALWAVFDFEKEWLGTLPAYLAWLAAAYFGYRHWKRDVFVLAGGVLSVIIVVTALLCKALLSHTHDSGSAFLFIGMAVLGMSTVGAMWLKSVAKEAA